MVDWETGTWPTPLTQEEFDRSVRQEEIDSTASWLIGARDLARERGVKFVVALAPVPVVDPAYAEFWSPWPRYRSYPMLRECLASRAATRSSRRRACRRSICRTISLACETPIASPTATGRSSAPTLPPSGSRRKLLKLR